MANTHSLDLELASSQYAWAADSASLSFAGDHTYEGWVNPESVSIGQNLVSKYAYTILQRSYRFLLTFGQGQVQYSSNGAGRDNFVTVGTLLGTADIGNWVHLAAAVDVSAQSVDFYRNGTFFETVTDTSGHTSVFNGTAKCVVGAGNVETAAEEFADGKFDEVRVWNDIRTSGEISANYLTELAGTEAGLVAYWKLNNAYTDSTANANNLTAVNSPVFSTSVPFTGVVGGVSGYKNLLGVGI